MGFISKNWGLIRESTSYIKVEISVKLLMTREIEHSRISRRDGIRVLLTFTGGAIVAGACSQGVESSQVTNEPANIILPENPASTPHRTESPTTYPTKTSTTEPTSYQEPTPYEIETPKPVPTECPSNLVSVEEADFLANHEVMYGDRERKVILMTYDDQGSMERINTILDVYKKYGGKATFFFTGTGFNDEGLGPYKDVIKRIVEEGHAFGSHGFKHTPHTTLDEQTMREYFRQWLSRAADVVPNYRVRFLRFPYGDRTKRDIKIAAEFGLQSVMWSVESGGVTKETFNYVVDRVAPGSVVLSHMHRYYDVYDAESIVSRLISDGYSLESMETGLSPQDKLPQRFRQNDFCFQKSLR